jgi:hypothetical protein
MCQLLNFTRCVYHFLIHPRSLLFLWNQFPLYGNSHYRMVDWMQLRRCMQVWILIRYFITFFFRKKPSRKKSDGILFGNVYTHSIETELKRERDEIEFCIFSCFRSNRENHFYLPFDIHIKKIFMVLHKRMKFLLFCLFLQKPESELKKSNIDFDIEKDIPGNCFICIIISIGMRRVVLATYYYYE